jgi:hypothetical protein
MNPERTLPLYLTFIGGIYGDDGYGLALGGDGSVYVTGPTSSPDYPTTEGAFQRVHAGVDPYNENLQNSDVFVTKLTSEGAMAYSTFLGGTEDESGNWIAVDADDNAYIAGNTESNDYRVRADTAYQPAAIPVPNTNGRYSNAFFTKLNASGSALLYSTYLGGTSYDGANGIAVDGLGKAYVVGYTFSNDFPASTRLGQGMFVTKFNPHASGNASVTYSTTLNGSGMGVDVDPGGLAYVVATSAVYKVAAGGDKIDFSVPITCCRARSITTPPRMTNGPWSRWATSTATASPTKLSLIPAWSTSSTPGTGATSRGRARPARASTARRVRTTGGTTRTRSRNTTSSSAGNSDNTPSGR